MTDIENSPVPAPKWLQRRRRAWLVVVACFLSIQAVSAVAKGSNTFKMVEDYWYFLTDETTYETLILLGVALAANGVFLALLAVAAILSVMRGERALRLPMLLGLIATMSLYIAMDLLGGIRISYTAGAAGGMRAASGGGIALACFLFLTWLLYFVFPQSTQPRPFATAVSADPESLRK